MLRRFFILLAGFATAFALTGGEEWKYSKPGLYFVNSFGRAPLHRAFTLGSSSKRRPWNLRPGRTNIQHLRGGISMSIEPTLITFDIDGTICVQDETQIEIIPNAMHTRAFSFAFKEVFGIDASINEVCLCNSELIIGIPNTDATYALLKHTRWPLEFLLSGCGDKQVKHQGSTDPLILIKVLVARGYAKKEVLQQLGVMQDAMVRYVNENRYASRKPARKNDEGNSRSADT
jgi:hypothetical protein